MGGRAELQLMGNEILDTGLQVSAQPPGKKIQRLIFYQEGKKH